MDATNPAFTASPALNSAERWNARIDATAAEMRSAFEAAGKPIPKGLQAAAGHLTGCDALGAKLGRDPISLAIESASASSAWDAEDALCAYAVLLSKRVAA